MAVKSKSEVLISDYIREMASICQSSQEYQGHGWGIIYHQNGSWNEYKQIDPIWESQIPNIGVSDLFIIHARSAYQDELIEIEYNMPYLQSDIVFAFNGELRGVKIRSQGTIGAQKLFNYFLRFENRGLSNALQTTTEIVQKKSDYIRAMNIVITDGSKLYVSSLFNENPDYFTMYYAIGDEKQIVCSETFGSEYNWLPIENGEMMVIS